MEKEIGDSEEEEGEDRWGRDEELARGERAGGGIWNFGVFPSHAFLTPPGEKKPLRIKKLLF